ncbi:hypothetical protein V7S43_010256 [Phytophthora oleae]|uniref:Myb-like domain-containing protein n=1 Tax=Phytophthora oleae TaxID=2107226 RepID=A0ABD3FHN1_9STRA
MNPGRPPTSGATRQQNTSLRHNTGARQGGSNEFSTVTSGSGRSEWRREEHGRFMQALELYGSRRTGDEWKHITAFVGSRTVEEVRLHGRQYLQRLVQQLPPSPEATSASRYLTSTGNQNDPNRQNHQVPRGIEHQKTRGSKGKRTVLQPGLPIGGSSALSAAALQCAQSMSVQFHNQPLQTLQQPQHQAPTAASRRTGRRSNPWSFQEDKAFETALAGWAGNKSYPWAKIAAAVPGKTVKDVRHRYEEMIGDVASIESGELPVPQKPTSRTGSVPSARPQRSPSSLSQRTVPPPPIEVPPRSVDKDGAFPSGSSTRSRRGSTGGISMLSPTFLDLLANEAESEEKSPLPLPFPGLTNLPSPLFSPTLLPSGPPGFFSPGTKKSAARGQQDKKFSSLESPSDVNMEGVDSTAASKSEDPRRSSTPRIWNDFLADDFKFDYPDGTTPSHSSRKTPRSKMSAGDTGKQDVEMTDASAA